MNRLPVIAFLSLVCGAEFFAVLGIVVYAWANGGYAKGMTVVMLFVGVFFGGMVLAEQGARR